MTEKGIEEILKSAFNNFEADVDPSVWANVQQAINVPKSTLSNHGTNGSVAGKAGVVAGKLGVKAIVAIVAAATGVTVATYFLLTDSQSHKVTPTATPSGQQAIPAVHKEQTPATSESGVNESNQAATSGENKITPERNVKENAKEISPAQFNSAKPQSFVPAGITLPAKDVSAANTVNSKQTTQSKPAVLTNATPSVSAKENAVKQEEPENTDENHAYQNDFADIKNYLEPETSSGKIALPNIFSPNGDGKNDEFKIKTKNLQSLVVTVFDMSGNQVYQWNGLDGKWDGNLPDGRMAPAGNYYYSVLAETTDGKHCIASSPLILRR